MVNLQGTTEGIKYQNYELVAGDGETVTVVVDNGNTDISSPTSATYEIEDPSDESTVASYTQSGGGISITDGPNGELEVTVDSADTSGLSGTYDHELQLVDSNGEQQTLFVGNVKFRDSII